MPLGNLHADRWLQVRLFVESKVANARAIILLEWLILSIRSQTCFAGGTGLPYSSII